jgi:hypothetical protein
MAHLSGATHSQADTAVDGTEGCRHLPVGGILAQKRSRRLAELLTDRGKGYSGEEVR